MYAPNPTEYTYSSSPEDNDCGDGGSVLSSSLFNRIDTLGGARRAVDVSPPPLMKSGGGAIVNPVQQAGRQNEDKMSSMTSSLDNMNSKPSPFFQVDDEVVAPNPSAFEFAAVAPEGPSSIGSTLSNIIASHKSAHQQQGYGLLLEQY
eukprot:scaffold4990_cov142-Skeletonema_dohrnii-CCMP3373.AAC.1